MEKINFKKELKRLYKPSPKQVEIVEVPEMNFLSIDEEGGGLQTLLFRKP